MRVLLVVTALLLGSAAYGESSARLRTVVTDITDAALPGVTVRISGGGIERVGYTDAGGVFLSKLPEGKYSVDASLEGLTPGFRELYVSGETVLSLQLAFEEEGGEEMILACGARCSDTPPVSPNDDPLCVEQRRDYELIAAMKEGDGSAAKLLRHRFAQEVSLYERVTIAEALLPRHDEDGTLFRFLAALAEEAVTNVPETKDLSGRKTFPRSFAARFAGHPIDVESHWWTRLTALRAIVADRRTLRLLDRAFDTRQDELLDAAIDGYAKQQRVAMLGEIEDAIRERKDRDLLLYRLIGFDLPAADAIVQRYLSQQEFDALKQERQNSSGAP